MASTHTVHIIGAGITGLACAWYLERLAAAHQTSLSVVIIEASARIGGKIGTQTIATSDGAVLIESGPDAMLHTKPWAVDLAEALGIDDTFITTNPDRRRLSLWNGDRLVPMPTGMHLIVPLRLWPFLTSPIMSLRGKLRNLIEPWIPGKSAPGDESMAHFVRRRFGAETLDVLGIPLMAGIYSADAEHLSMQATFPQFLHLEQRHGNLSPALRNATPPTATSAKSPFYSFTTGMQTMVDALQQQLRAVIRLHTHVERIRASDANVTLTIGTEEATSDAVVVTIPANRAALIFADAHPDIAQLLDRITYQDSGTISLVYATSAHLDEFPGYGVLIPKRHGIPFSAITISTIKFTHRAPAPMHVVRLFFGSGALFSCTDEVVVAQASAAVATILGIHDVPTKTQVVRWPHGAPQYPVGHLASCQTIRDTAPPRVFFAGSSFDGVGIPDCVRQAQTTAQAVFASLPKERFT